MQISDTWLPQPGSWEETVVPVRTAGEWEILEGTPLPGEQRDEKTIKGNAMNCPVCNVLLHAIQKYGVNIDIYPGCKGV